MDNTPNGVGGTESITTQDGWFKTTQRGVGLKAQRQGAPETFEALEELCTT